jgi:hypothetical protein
MACLTACSAAAACGHPVEHAQRSAKIGRDFPYSCFWGVTWLTLSQPSACNDRGPQCALDRGGCNARHYRQHHHVRICHDIRGIWSGAHLGIRLGHVADRRRALNLDGWELWPIDASTRFDPPATRCVFWLRGDWPRGRALPLSLWVDWRPPFPSAR